MKVPDVYKQESSVDAESIAEKLQNNRLLRRKRKGGASSKRYKKYNSKRRNKNGQSSGDDVSTQRPDPVSSSNDILSQGTVTVPEEDVVADSGVKDVVRMIGGGDDVSTQRPDPVSSSNDILSQGIITVPEEDVMADSGVNDGVRMIGGEESQLEVAEVDLPCSLFIAEDVDHRLPIPVLSSVTPRHAAGFLLHCLLMIGEVSTEPDLRCAGSMKETMAKAKLIPNEHLDDEEHLKQYSIHLFKRVIREVFPYQALTMRELQEYIIKGKRLFDSVLLEDAIPLDSLP